MRGRHWIGAILMLALPLASQAVVIIDSSTTGRYNAGLGDLAPLDGPGGFFLLPIPTEGDPTLPPVIPLPFVPNAPAFGTNWLAGDYTGGTWSAGPVAIPATWTVNHETAIVYSFALAAASNVHIDLGVDNGLLIWLNGHYIFGAQAPGGSSINEYDIDLSLAPGNYNLQILREDHGGATGFNILADAVVRVPEPGSLSLLGLGLLSLAFVSRRRNAA